jgi:hypothetical protein
MLTGLALGLTLLGGCSRERDSAACGERDAERPVDSRLLAFLSRARAAHHLADAAEAAHELTRAMAPLMEVVTGAGKDLDAPEVREVLADTFARLADLESQGGDPIRARGHIEQGLALVPTPTYFRGHLYEILGLVEERRAATLKATGDLPGAVRAEEAALEALETAMKIQAQVIDGTAPPKR